jgi:hypothetical protein
MDGSIGCVSDEESVLAMVALLVDCVAVIVSRIIHPRVQFLYVG